MIDDRDKEMLCLSIPMVDYWEMKEELDRLSDCVERMEKILEAFIILYQEERVKNWELILREMLEAKELKGVKYGNTKGRR